MDATRFSPRTLWLIFSDAAFIFGGVVLAMYLRLGLSGSAYQLNENNGWLKITFAAGVCLLILYFYDLYDYTVMGNRRELMLQLVQAIGVAWVLLALVFYFVPPMLIGRGVATFSVVIVLISLLVWRILIHLLTGDPEIGEKILVVGTGQSARDTAEAVWERRDAGYRIVGFVTENGAKPHTKIGESEIVGTVGELGELIKSEKADRLVIAVRERRGTFPTETLLKMSLAGNVAIEECASFFERVTGKAHVDMLRPSWLIFAGRKRDTRLKNALREVVHRVLAVIGFTVSLPMAVLTAILIKLDSKGEIFTGRNASEKTGV